MNLKEQKLEEDMLLYLESWAEVSPKDIVKGPLSGKAYTRTEWVQAIKNDNDDAKLFLQELYKDLGE